MARDRAAQTIIRPQPGFQEAFLSCQADICVGGGAAGAGKMLALGTPLPTGFGWSDMGSIRVADILYDETGEQCQVIAVHPIDLAPESYRLTFDDGEAIEACADHQWLTYTAKELESLTKRDPEFRRRRREKRPSRSKGTKSAKFVAMMAERNKRISEGKRKEKPCGELRTTKEIFETVRYRSEKRVDHSRANHAIPVAKPLVAADRELLIPPYLLGLWLGDGTTSNGDITTADEEILQAFQDEGYDLHVRKSSGKGKADTWGPKGFSALLRKLKLVGHKHIPLDYLRASHPQRLAVFQGLMDTDGCVDENGSSELTLTNLELAENARDLGCSLGLKMGWSEGRAMLYGKDCGPRYRMNFTADFQVFRLPRKKVLQKGITRRTTKFRYIVACERIASKPMRCITVDSPSGLFLAGRAMIPTHNSFALLLDPLRYRDNPNFGAVIFRKTYREITEQGGLWDESTTFYPLLGAKPKVSELQWVFPSGMKVTFSHLQHDKDLASWQGSQVPLISVDEGTHFTEHSFWYLLSRNRSTCGVRPYFRITCNPDADSWLAKFIEWWVDQETGYPIIERSGVIRWFFRVGGSIIWADTKEELYQHVPNSIPKGINKADLIKSATFIPATIYGNKELLKKDNAYLGNLLAQDPVNRARFLDGNWKVRSKGGDIFHADWFTPEIERAALPADLKLVRAWDLAATEPHKGNLDPDWTAGVLLGKAKNGMYYVLEARRTRGTPHHVAKFVTNTAHFDGRHVKIVAEQEIGSAGKFVMAEFTRMLDGFNFKGVPSTGNKTQRAGPAANQAEAGNMKVVKGQWTDMFLAEIPYTGADTGHDDIGDALSLAHSQLAPPQKKGGIIALSSPRPIPKETKRRMSPFGYQWDSPPNQVIDTTPPKGPLTVFDV